MPRGRPRKIKANGATEVAPETPTIQMIEATAFHRLNKAVANAEADKNEAVSSIGGLINAANEKKRLDKRAYGIFRRLSKLSDEKLATCLANLDYYRKIGSLDDRANAQSQMFEEGENEGNVVEFEPSTHDFVPEADVS